MRRQGLPERRIQRSDEPARALELWLRGVADRCGARAISVGTVDGLPIASWGDEEEWTVAAAGSLFASGDHFMAIARVPDIHARRITLPNGFELVLSSCGVPVPDSDEVGPHVGRILA